MNSADDIADLILRKGGVYLKPTARALLLSTFVEDGIRMFNQWGEQTAYIKHTWKSGAFLAGFFVLFNLVCQLVPSVVVLLMREEKQKKLVKISIGCLASVMFVQTMAYSVLWNYHFFARNLAVAGSLMLLFAEISEDKKTFFPGVPEIGGNRKVQLLQLSGRNLLVVMFLTLVQFDSIFRMILEGAGLVLVLLVAVGKFTKVSALSLVALLLLQNVILNDFWNEYSSSAKFDFKKYDFFQTMSVVGGLLMIVALGPGTMSMDGSKKDY